MTTEPRKPLDPIVALRVSIARTAIQLELGHRIPGIYTPDRSFENLTHAACTEERGWNALLAAIGTEVEQLRRIAAQAFDNAYPDA